MRLDGEQLIKALAIPCMLSPIGQCFDWDELTNQFIEASAISRAPSSVGQHLDWDEPIN